jgi:LCP family protein required for cell wall assembly
MRTAAMLSIPRDLWVEIPGFGNHKINQAYRLGEANHTSEGGAGLMIDTIENLLEISIEYYALIDFNSFVKVIDEIGGVKIDIPESLKIDPIGDSNTVVLQPGVQTLPGDLTLAYVRNRDSAGSDFDRIKRQHQVIIGIQKRLISFQMIPILIDRAPVLYEEIKSGIQTNLTLQQVVQFGWLTAQIPEENIRMVSIQPEQVIDMMSYDGLAILMPIPDELFKIRDEFMNIEQPTSPESVTQMSFDDQIIEENANVLVKNGTLTSGLAAQTQAFLDTNNINVIDATNADQIYNKTTIIDYSGKPYTVKFLSELLCISPDKIFQRYEPNSEADIVILLGEDWAENNNMP